MMVIKEAAETDTMEDVSKEAKDHPKDGLDESKESSCIMKSEKLVNCFESEEDDLVFIKDIHPITYYIVDREEMINQVFSAIKGKCLQAILPASLQNLPLDDLKQLCVQHVKKFSKNKLKNILNGEHYVSSASDEELVKVKPKEPEVVSVPAPKKPKIEPLLEDEDDTLNLQIQRKDDSLNLKKEKKAIRRIKKLRLERQKASGGNPESGKSLMDLLELEMRARAIRALLQKQQGGEGDQSMDEEELSALLSDLDGLGSESSGSESEESKSVPVSKDVTPAVVPETSVKTPKKKIPIKFKTLAEDMSVIDSKIAMKHVFEEEADKTEKQCEVKEETEGSSGTPSKSPPPPVSVDEDLKTPCVKTGRRYRKSNANESSRHTTSSSESDSMGEDSEEEKVSGFPEEPFDDAVDIDMAELIEKAKANKPVNPEDYEEGELDEELNEEDLELLKKKKLEELKKQEEEELKEQERREQELKEQELKDKMNRRRSRKSRRRRRSDSTSDFRRAVYGSYMETRSSAARRGQKSNSPTFEGSNETASRSLSRSRSRSFSPRRKTRKVMKEEAHSVKSPEIKESVHDSGSEHRDGLLDPISLSNDAKSNIVDSAIAQESDASMEEAPHAESNEDKHSRLTANIEKKVTTLNKQVEHLQANVFSQVTSQEDRMGDTVKEFDLKIPLYASEVFDLKQIIEKEIEAGIQDTGVEDQVYMGLVEVLDCCSSTLSKIKSSMETLKVYYEARKKEVTREVTPPLEETAPESDGAEPSELALEGTSSSDIRFNSMDMGVLEEVSPEEIIVEDASNDTLEKESLDEIIKTDVGQEESTPSVPEDEIKAGPNPTIEEPAKGETIEDVAGLTWGMRWLQSEKVQKVYNTSKMFSKVRNKIKSLKKQSKPEGEPTNPEEEERNQDNAIKVIGSIEEYEKIFGKQIPKREVEPSVIDASPHLSMAQASAYSLPSSKVIQAPPKVPVLSVKEAAEEGEIDSEKENSEEEELWSRIMGD